MTQDDLKLVLEALKFCHGGEPCGTAEAIAVIEKALAQPEQEPVAYGMLDTMIGYDGRMMYVRLDKGQDGCTVPLYTHSQRTWIGLTDEERSYYLQSASNVGWWQAAQFIEAKLKLKNGYAKENT